MSLDKSIWHKAISDYRKCNEAKFVEQVLNAGKKSIKEKWQEYEELISLCWQLKPKSGLYEQRHTVEEWEAYYISICRFEERRGMDGKETTTSII